MLRYYLSAAFAAVAPQSNNTKRLRRISLDVYRDEMLESVKSLLQKKGKTLETELSPLGECTFQVTGTDRKFRCSTEWSDLLLAAGREAAFKFETDLETKIFYYGDSWSPDNAYQWEDRLRYQTQAEEIASYIEEQSVKVAPPPVNYWMHPPG